jgi:hypothetical protein
MRLAACLLVLCVLWVPSVRADADEDTALQELLHDAGGVVKHWNQVPALVVLDSVMTYRTGELNSYTATSLRLTDEDVDDLVTDLTGALRLLTGDAYVRFASVRRETVPAGTDARVLRSGQIVVGRYRNVQHLLHDIGLGGTATRADGTINGAAIILDDEFDSTSDKRRLLRTHELGHALGYNHVLSRPSIMNPSLGPEPTSFDRDAARIAFHVPVAASN